ncbi:polysaccharide deacetylase family protein [Desulfovibrio sp. ZJ369]|uniref:polysaccharide deacetylase family protein n=1 Tax=Desulfovibrio sp. ZJ369 TaxID=2709793 RepID=UPI0013EC5213|nr:polysaccharide deacetylase family protein [Desulfovibrio sp. ZJ369]
MKFSLKTLNIAALCALLILMAESLPARVLDGGSIMDQRMNENLCAITFDDGPSRNTPQLLDLLNQYGIPATFFVLGQQAELYPDLVRRIVAEGHEVGNHSFSHPNLRLLAPERKIDEIRRTDAVLRSLGAAPLFLRPPYGAFDTHTVEAAEALGLSVVLWSVDSRDWQHLPADYAKLHNTRGYAYPPGMLRGVFLFHDTHKSTVEDLPRIIRELRTGGCQRFVTVSEYLEGVLDPEPGLLMTRRSLRETPGQMPLAARHEMEAVKQSAEMPPPRSWPAGSGPVPLARSSKPWQPESPAPPLPGQALEQHNTLLPPAGHAAGAPVS